MDSLDKSGQAELEISGGMAGFTPVCGPMSPEVESLLVGAIVLELQDFFYGSAVQPLVEIQAPSIAAGVLARYRELLQRSKED